MRHLQADSCTSETGHAHTLAAATARDCLRLERAVLTQHQIAAWPALLLRTRACSVCALHAGD